MTEQIVNSIVHNTRIVEEGHGSAHGGRPGRRGRDRPPAHRRAAPHRRRRGGRPRRGRRRAARPAFAAEFGIPRHGARPGGDARRARGRRRHPRHAPPRCTPPRPSQVMEAGKHVLVEIPMADTPGRRRGGRRRPAAHRGHGHGVPHPPLQPEPPVGPPPDRRRRADAAAPGRRRRSSSAARTRTRSASPARGPTTCCGTTPATRSTCSSTRPARCPPRAWAQQGPPHPELGIAMDMTVGLRAPVRRAVHAGPVVQQRRAARHDVPLHRRHRHLHRPLRRPGRRLRQARSTCPLSARLDGRHREPGPRVRRRRARGTRAGRERRAVPADHADPRPPRADPVNAAAPACPHACRS